MQVHMFDLSTHILIHEWMSKDDQSSSKLYISIEGPKYKVEEIFKKVEQKKKDGKY